MRITIIYQHIKFALVLFLIIISALACTQKEKKQESANGLSLIQHSKQLNIEKFDTHFRVNILNPNASESSSFTYILYENKKPAIAADAFIRIPVERAICLSTSHLPAFPALGQSEALIAFPNTDLIYNKDLLDLVKKGSIADIGQKNGVNVEKIMALQPDLIMAYSMGSSMEQLKPLDKAGIPIILNTDYLENTPLGRAEWIKLTAVLLNKYPEGDSVFKAIETDYLNTKEQLKNIKSKPDVMAGVMYGDVWYVPGGDSFVANFIRDAGGDYIWSSNNSSGSLELSYESVLSHAQDADYWIGAASFTSLEDLKNTNNKYTLFDAFKNQNVYSYTKRVNETGSNDYLESGFLRADLVLKDYVKMLHPDKLEDYTTTYFEPLKP